MTRFNFSTFAPVLKTGQTTSYTSNDDGAYETGRVIGTRFVDNGDNTITDLATGLMWIKDHDAIGAPWNGNVKTADGIDNCYNLDYAGHTDWRLPNANELLSIVDFGIHSPCFNSTFFPNSSTGNYIISTTYSPNTNYGIYFSGATGIMSTSAYSVLQGRARPVRFGVTAQTITDKTLHEFGRQQTVSPTYAKTSYFDYDDGYYEVGSPTYPRIIDNGDNTATDRLTGLMWTKAFPSTTTRNLGNAISYCESLSFAGYTDWRLPNVRELASLIDFSKTSQTVIGGGILTPTMGSINGRCSTSTTNPQTTTRNYVVYFNYQSIQTILKTGTNYVWPVRGGK